jgi:organic hydroperoxide reductase OsmC/OhrA
MHPYPHLYTVSATGAASGAVTVASAALPDIETAPPPEFDGPGGVWSPETLLCAAVADCYILTFRAVARAGRFEWLALECRVEGTLERVDNQAQFTRFATFAKLTVPAGADVARARALLERAESACLISNSLRGTRTLGVEVLEAAAA